MLSLLADYGNVTVEVGSTAPEPQAIVDSAIFQDMSARKRFIKIVIGASLIGAGFLLYALSFGPCGGGYFTLIPAAALALFGIGKIVMSFRPAE